MHQVAPCGLRHGLGTVLRWLWSPRALSLTVRPAFGVAALALAAVVSVYASRSAQTAAASPPRVMVQFRLGEVEAHEVALVGDFNGWRPEHRLHQTAAGVWSVDVALEPGVYNYVFVVDGRTWRLDPLAPRVTDGFGGASSRVAVLAPEVRS
jgi:1,4-alpha-glucan branching enzyme